MEIQTLHAMVTRTHHREYLEPPASTEHAPVCSAPTLIVGRPCMCFPSCSDVAFAVRVSGAVMVHGVRNSILAFLQCRAIEALDGQLPVPVPVVGSDACYAPRHPLFSVADCPPPPYPQQKVSPVDKGLCVLLCISRCFSLRCLHIVQYRVSSRLHGG